MTYRTTILFVAAAFLLGIGCSAIVSSTLEEKDDGGGFCPTDPECDDGEPCNGLEYCEADFGDCVNDAALADGEDCEVDGSLGTCAAEVCIVGPACGDGNIDPTEDCDDGNLMDDDGCNNDCTYSCTVNDDCDDGFVCNGPGTCLDMIGNRRICGGPIVPDGTACGADNMGTCLVLGAPLCCDLDSDGIAIRCCDKDSNCGPPPSPPPMP